MSRLTFIIAVLFFQVAVPSFAGNEPSGMPDELGQSTALDAGAGLFIPAGGSMEEATGPTKALVEGSYGKLPLLFIENRGQVDGEVAYYVQGSDKTLYFTSRGITFALAGKESEGGDRWILKLDFLGADPAVKPRGEDRQEAVIGYFRGGPDAWKTAIPTYGRLVYPDLWPGIDLVYSGTVNRLKYEFVVRPGADPGTIRLAYRGADAVTVKDTGELRVSTPVAEFEDGKPQAYQAVEGVKKQVPMEYARLEETGDGGFHYGFDVGRYDPAEPLILDPEILVYCGYIGGAMYDYGIDVAVDDACCTYVAGHSSPLSTGFPVVVGPDLTHNGGGYDIFVAKLDAYGTTLIYCGYIGGSDDDRCGGIAVDDSGNAYVTGYAYSTESSFPAVVGPDLTHNGGRDAFVAKVNSSGTGLVYCGYLGGTGDDEGMSIAVDESDNAYVTGSTGSWESSFPVMVGPDLTYNGSSSDVFVARVNPAGTGLVYCGYIGGSSLEGGFGIAVDDSGNAYVSGRTKSTESSFPVIAGPDLSYNGSDADAFVAKVNSAGTLLVYCGYIGGSGQDYGCAIDLDDSGNAYITGYTGSTEWDFPLAVGPDLTYNGGYRDVFVAKVNATGTGLDFCGYIGGENSDLGNGIAVDGSGNAYIVGWTSSTESSFPVLVGPDLTFNGDLDAFVAKVDATGTCLDYCGYLGGTHEDIGEAIAVDGYGFAYVTGYTSSNQSSFPVVAGPDLTFNSETDAFVAKVTVYPDFNLPPDAPPSKPSGPTFGIVEVTYSYSTSTTDPEGDQIFYWFDWGDGTDSGWLGPYNSGESCTASKSWDHSAVFSVRAKAKDTWEEESGWSEALLVAISDSPTVIYVDADATGLNDGSSWEDAFTQLQDALMHAQGGEEIWVAEGTYEPDKGGGQIPGDRTATFSLKDQVSLYGGFDGKESKLDERDVEEHLSILSGDLLGNDPGYFHPIHYDENSTNVVTAGGAVANGAVLDGFTVTGGYANNPNPGGSDDRGAGALIAGGANNVVVRNCILTLNCANVGGGMAIPHADTKAKIIDCRFIENRAIYVGGGYYDNSRDGSVTELENCSFLGNLALDDGGAVYVDNLYSSPVFLNCQFCRNDADEDGGGFYVRNGAEVTLVHSTLCTNRAKGYGGGMYIASPSGAVAKDCIFWGNSDKGGSDESGQIHCYGSLTIDYSCVQGWTGGYGGTGNIGDDPLLVAGPEGFFYLSQTAAGQSSDSPCVDAGSDLAGNAGMDALWTRTDEEPDADTVDTGFHYGPFPSSWNVPLSTDVVEVSESQGGAVKYLLKAGEGNADRDYIMLGSVTGTIPGFPLPGGLTLPLNWDVFTGLIFKLGGTAILPGFKGKLDSLGRAHAQLNTYGPLPPGTAGIHMFFAFLLYNPYDFVSNPVIIEIVP